MKRDTEYAKRQVSAEEKDQKIKMIRESESRVESK
jgi:hypothetical protein